MKHYIEKTDQFYWDPYREATGKTFAMDGTDYDSSYKKPKLSDAYRFLSRHFGPKTRLQMVVVGRLYKGQSKISGVPLTTDMDTLEYFAVQGGHGGGGTATLESKMEELSGYTGFERVTGLYFRVLD